MARGRVAAPASAGEARGEGFRAVGVAVAKLAAPVIGKSGRRHLGRLKAAWPEVAGSEWSAAAWPWQLGRDGTLKLRVLPAAALELQHRAPLFIERINLFLGSPAVTRLVLRQGLPPAPVVATSPLRRLTAEESAALARALAPIADPKLRTALDGLGRALFATRVAPDRKTN